MGSVSAAALLVLGMVAFANYKNGTLPDWLRAKFLNAAAPPPDGPAPAMDDVSGGGDWEGGPAGPAGKAHLGGAPLVWVRPNVKMAATAAVALRRAEARLGRQIRIGNAYRGPDEQRRLANAKPGLAAPQGKSYHERGLAMDLVNENGEDVRRALEAENWRQFSRAKEPWHWSYGVTG